MTRLEMVALAQEAALEVERHAAAFYGPLRIVVVVTDEEGEHVGVGTTTGREDTEACLRAALEGKHRTEPLTIDLKPEPCACHGEPYCEEDK